MGRPTIEEVRLTPVLVADPPLLNIQGLHQPHTPRLVVEVRTAGGHSGVGETYGDTKYLAPAQELANRLPGHSVRDMNALDAPGVVAQARLLAERYGFRSFKLKGGVLPPDEEVATVRALAAEFPGSPSASIPTGPGRWRLRSASRTSSGTSWST